MCHLANFLKLGLARAGNAFTYVFRLISIYECHLPVSSCIGTTPFAHYATFLRAHTRKHVSTLDFSPASSPEDATPALPSRLPSTMSKYDDYGMPVGAYSEPESLTHQAWRVARAFVVYRVKPRLRDATSGGWQWRRMLSLGRILVVVWWIVLYWGERSVFKSSIDSCRWENWENWVCCRTVWKARTKLTRRTVPRRKSTQTRLRRRSPAR